MQLSQKERMYLEDLKSHEELCIQKYTKYANESECQNLQQIFQNLASKEREHYNTINQILSGQVPNINAQGQGQSQSGMQSQAGGMQGQSGMQSQQSTMQSQQGSAGGQGQANYSRNDYTLVSDMLSMEKHVSSTYDTAIFEFQDPNLRQVLNHIQKEEQEHGQELFSYMQSKGMYNVQ